MLEITTIEILNSIAGGDDRCYCQCFEDNGAVLSELSKITNNAGDCALNCGGKKSACQEVSMAFCEDTVLNIRLLDGSQDRVLKRILAEASAGRFAGLVVGTEEYSMAVAKRTIELMKIIK